MFERLTERARKVLSLAEEEAVRLKFNYIGSEHLLLGLIAEETGAAARALTKCGITLDAARERVATISPYHPTRIFPSHSSVSMTPLASKVVELGLREALQLGHNYIGTEHLLLGLLRSDGGYAYKILKELQKEGTDIRDAVMDELTDDPDVTVTASVAYETGPDNITWHTPEYSTIDAVTDPYYDRIGRAYVDMIKGEANENTAQILISNLHGASEIIHRLDERLLILEAALRSIDESLPVLPQDVRTALYAPRPGK